jgi:hypothetical protein
MACKEIEMSLFKLLASVGILLLATSTAFADQPEDRNPNKPGLGWGSGGSQARNGSNGWNGSNGSNAWNGSNGSNGQVVGVPAPLAGVGLPVLVVAGAYVWIRNHRRNRLDKPSD